MAAVAMTATASQAAVGNAAFGTGMRRRLSRVAVPRWVAAGAGVAVVLSLAAGCGGGAPGPASGPLPGPLPDPGWPGPPGAGDAAGEGSAADAGLVRSAASRTAAVATATYRLEVFLAEPLGPVPLVQVDGETDLAGQRSGLVIRQWLTPGSVAAAPDGDPTEVVIDDDTVYLRSPALGEVAGTGDRWLALRDNGGSSPGASAPQSVSGLLAALAGVGVAAANGSGEVAGVGVDWFVVDLDGQPGAEPGNGSPAPIGAFVPAGGAAVVGVDDGGFVRLVELEVRDPLGPPGPEAAAPSGRATPPTVLRLVLSELGGPVEVRVPGDGEVVAVP